MREIRIDTDASYQSHIAGRPISVRKAEFINNDELPTLRTIPVHCFKSSKIEYNSGHY